MPFAHRRSPQSMRAFYNWFSRFYPMVEKNLGPILEDVARERIASFPETKRQTAIDYACGSGMLSLILGRYFRAVEGRDASEGMLSRAEARAREAGLPIVFRRGDLLAIEEPAGSFDRVFMSFALHLFSPEQIPLILRRLLDVARESVMIVDHTRQWDAFTAFQEWIEGSYYGKFIRMDFRAIAGQIGAARYEEWNTKKATVLLFGKKR
jgi:ubiquinone/menaquinone biosynthesis C-methylase UbiE